MKRTSAIIAFFLLWVPLCLWAQSADTVKILWVGSSSTYCHDLPQQATEWLEPHFAPRPVKAYLVGRSGTGFHEYLEPGFEAQYGLKEGQTLLLANGCQLSSEKCLSDALE